MKFITYKKRKLVQKAKINARKLLKNIINVRKIEKSRKNHKNLGKGCGNDLF